MMHEVSRPYNIAVNMTNCNNNQYRPIVNYNKLYSSLRYTVIIIVCYVGLE